MESRRLLAVYIVDTFEDGFGICGEDGIGNANCTLRSAVIAANNNPGADEIRLPPGTYTRDSLLDRLQISESLTLRGLGNGPDEAVIDAGGTNGFSVFSDFFPAPPVVARFENLTVQNGFDVEEGAGILAGENTRVEVINSIIQDNVVSDPQFVFAGGGIYTDGSLVIEDSIIRRNSAEGGIGGGVAFLGSSAAELIVRNTLFEANSAGEGGGLNATGSFGGEVLLENVTFRDNTAQFDGGGAYIYLVNSVEIIDSQFLQNRAGEAGGGLYLLDNGSSGIARSTFDGNIAEGNGNGSGGGGGGGLAILTDALVEDSLFQNNQVLGTRPFAGDLAFDEGGGGIGIAQDFDFQPTVTILRSSILNNRAPLAGGIGAANAHVTLREVTVRGNEAFGSLGGAGGIGFAQETLDITVDPAQLRIFDSVITDNTSLLDAGGIGVADAVVEIVGSSISGNSAGGRAGGLGIIGLTNPASARLESSTVVFNSAGDIGGGLGAIDAGIELLNVTVSDNSAGAAGGGIAFFNSDHTAPATVSFSTIAFNTSAEPGSNVASSGWPLLFTGTLLADPQTSTPLSPVNAAAAPGPVVSLGFNLDSDGSTGFDQPGDLVGVDPLLGPLADNGGPVMTRELLPGSPAIDAGGTSPPTVDARGFPRPVDGTGDGVALNDIGAFEVQQAAIIEVDLAMSIIAEPRGVVERGGLIDVTITASNLSTAPATGVVVTAELSEGLAFVSGGAGQGSLTEQDGVITVSGFSLGGGESATVTLVVQVRDTADLPIEEFVISEISADQPDPDPSNNVASVDILAAPTLLHTLTTGADEGSVTLQVDAFGGFGTGRFFESSIAEYNPVGPIPPASAVFESYVVARTEPSGPRAVLEQGSGFDILTAIAGSETSATSRFGFGPLVVDLTQTVEPTLDAQGNRLGSRLIQSYQVTNTATSGPATFLDLVRYVDADLFFDGTLIDGGGVLTDASGELILFTNDRGGTAATDTTFVGITASGGAAPSVGRFELDDFRLLEDRVLGGDPLRDQVAGDIDGSGFINPGEEYDVAMALRNLLTLAPGETLTYETVTLFGTRPETVAPPPPAGDLAGRVVCTDADGVAQGVAGVTVFIDLNGNRRLDTAGPNPEPFTVTDAQGNYVFTGLDLPAGGTANVIAQNPPACFPAASEIGVTRVAIPTGSLSRAIETLDFNLNGQSDLVVANDLSNDVVVLLNAGGEFSVGPTFALGHRPQDVAVWQPEGAPPTIAVAAIGTPADRGFLYVIENGNVQQFTSGDGPISVVADDFNGDGQVDFVTASFRSGTVVGRMSGETEERLLVNAEVPRAVVSGSLRGNDVRDLVVVSSGFQPEDGFEVIVLLNDGNADFTPLRERISGAGGVDVSLADVTGDGRDEIVVAGFDGLIRIYGFDPANAGIQLLETLPLSRGIQAVVARDLNDDGFVDLVVANARNETIELFMGSPDGFLANRTISGVPTPGALTVGNFDDDGLLDVAVANLFGTGTPARLPSTATILGLTVAEQEIELRPGEVNRVDFGFRHRPVGRSERTPESFNFDVNRDGEVTALDALVILNTVADAGRAEAEGGRAKARRERFKTDVNGDGLTTPLDALLVLNRLAQKQRAAAEAESPVVAASAVGTPPANDSEDDRRRREQAADAVFAGDSRLF